MRRAGPIDSPTDPFASVPLPKRGKKPKVDGLPPGVSRDIFGPQDRPDPEPAPASGGTAALPPVAPPPQPWPMQDQAQPPGPPEPQPAPAYEPDTPRRGLLPTLLVVAVVLGLAAYLVPAVAMSGQVLPGTRVSGIDIGGLTINQAADRLRAQLASRLERPVTVNVGGREEVIQPDEAGLELDVVATLGEASSGFPGPGQVWQALTGTTELEPALTVDSSQLTRSVEGLAEIVDRPPKEGRVAFVGLRPQALMPQEGALLDRQAAVEAIGAAFLRSHDNISLSLAPAAPKSSEETVRQALADARRAVAAPLTLTHAGRSATLTPAAVAASLSYVSDASGGLQPRFDAEKALKSVEGGLVGAANRPRDATYQIVGDRPVLVPARQGRGVDADRLSRDVVEALGSPSARTVPVTLAAARPRRTTGEVSGLGIKEKVAEFTTAFACCQPRAGNIRRMAQALDGHLVLPKQTFSFNTAVGEPTAEAGYVEAPQVVGGRLVNVVGGGGSQFATTLYNAVFAGGYEGVEHTPMDYHTPHYPIGRDAAVLFPGRDYKWLNDSEHGVLIKTTSTDTSVSVTLWSTRRYDKVETVVSDRREVRSFRREVSKEAGCLPTEGQAGFTVDVTRVFFKGGEEVKRDERQVTKYRPQAQVTCANGQG
ncbi:VanW family protein [Nonomuraea longicatena]|uniref:VanW family protein n=1 Tax=Nonomuraea longicatena TaxID=83682 RepID=A0ABP3ZGF2_9ACTN